MKAAKIITLSAGGIRMRKFLGAAACVMSAWASPVVAKSAEQQVLTEEGPDALIILQAEWWAPAPSMRSAFKLELSPYDPDAQKVSGALLGKFALIEAKKSNFIDDYLVTRIKPGRWVVQAYSKQDNWSLCFNAGSLQFEVKAGEVVYLGRFDSEAQHRDLTLKVVTSGKQYLRSTSFADYFDLPYPPRFQDIESDQFAKVKDMIRTKMRGVTAPVNVVRFAPGKFGTGSTLVGERRCGGYFPVSAKANPG